MIKGYLSTDTRTVFTSGCLLLLEDVDRFDSPLNPASSGHSLNCNIDKPMANQPVQKYTCIIT